MRDPRYERNDFYARCLNCHDELVYYVGDPRLDSPLVLTYENESHLEAAQNVNPNNFCDHLCRRDHLNYCSRMDYEETRVHGNDAFNMFEE